MPQMVFWSDIVSTLKKNVACINNAILNSEYHPLISSISAQRIAYYLSNHSFREKYGEILILRNIYDIDMHCARLQMYYQLTRTSESLFSLLIFVLKDKILIVETLRMHTIIFENAKIYGSSILTNKEKLFIASEKNLLFFIYKGCISSRVDLRIVKHIYDREFIRFIFSFINSINERRINIEVFESQSIDEGI